MVSFSTTDERINKIDSLVELGKYPDRSTFINQSIDFHFIHIETKYLTDFIYYIGFPFLGFIFSIIISIYLANIYFFVLTGIIGIYLMILIFLYYKKYRGRKWR